MNTLWDLINKNQNIPEELKDINSLYLNKSYTEFASHIKKLGYSREYVFDNYWTQKQLAKKFKYLENQVATLYVGAVPCSCKCACYEISTKQLVNEFGNYEEKQVKIIKTWYNGYSLKITTENFAKNSKILDFKVNIIEVNFKKSNEESTNIIFLA